MSIFYPPSSLAVTSSGLSCDVSDAGLPSEKVMASGKNGDDDDLLLFRDGLGVCDIRAGTLRLFISWSVTPCSRGQGKPGGFYVPGSYQERCDVQMRDPYDMLFQDGE
ncbi:hypothetical protein Tco_0018474 [Tanacetum coccineum]